MRLPVLFVIIFIWSLKTTAQTIPWDTYHPEPFNPATGGFTAFPRCDDCSVLVNLPFTFNFYGLNYTSAYVNTNGTISFGVDVPFYSTQAFPSNLRTPMIAPYWADVDTRTARGTYTNQVWYKVYADRLVVIWDSVGRFANRIDSLSKFEAMLADNSAPLHRTAKDWDVRFTYDTLSWVRGDANPANSYPAAGWDAGDLVKYYNLPGSATSRLTGYPGPFSRAYQFNNIREAQTLPAIPAAPSISYPNDTLYYSSTAPTWFTPTNTGGYIPTSFPYGTVFTQAGSSAGFIDNVTSLNAKFNKPVGLATDRLGNIYVGDCGNSRVRKISSGNVTTYSSLAVDSAAIGLTTNLNGTVYCSYGKAAYATGGPVNANYGKIPSYLYNNPTGIAVDSAGNVYVADRTLNKIHFSTASGNATTVSMGFMNPVYAGTGAAGMANGAAASATFNQPAGVALDPSGNLYVADLGNNQIRKITKAGVVSLFAGSATGVAGLVNGTGTAARFNKPFALTLDRFDNVYVADSGNHVIRKITPAGVVTTLAGSGVAGLNDTIVAGAAQFNGPAGIGIDISTSIAPYSFLRVSDAGNNRIRSIALTGYTITPALPAGLYFTADGYIVGLASLVLPAATYTVTAYNNGGSSSFSFVLAPPPVSLPIKLDNIRATNKGTINEVIWNSVSEEVGDVYQVERSTDASHFITLGTISGKAINGSSYIYIDQEPITGTNYYRLKFLNIDGSNGYSKIVSAVKNDAFGVAVFPNPVKSEVTIRVNGEINGTATVTLYNISGKQQINSRVSGKQITLSMNGLPAGMYLVRYHDDQHSESFPVVKE